MRRLRHGAVGVLVAVAVCGTGCATHRPPALHVPPATLPSAAELQGALSARRDAVRSLRALAHLRYRDAEGAESSREAIIVDRPDRLRVEVLSLFGSVFVLTANHGAITAYARQEDTVYRGPASPDNLWRYARLALPLNDVVDLVLGMPPARTARRAHVAFDAEVGAIRLVQELDSGAQTVWFSEATLPVAAAQHDTDGHPEWHASFADYEQHGALAIATRVGLELPQWSRSMEITLQDVDVNPDLDTSIFAFQIPPGSKVVDLAPVAD